MVLLLVFLLLVLLRCLVGGGRGGREVEENLYEIVRGGGGVEGRGEGGEG